MNIIQVNYDLGKPIRDYPALYAYLTSFGTRARPLQSLWFIKTSKSASTIRDELMELIDVDDKVLTVNVTGDYWATSFKNKDSAWMKTHMRSVRRARRAA